MLEGLYKEKRERRSHPAGSGLSRVKNVCRELQDEEEEEEGARAWSRVRVESRFQRSIMLGS